jgi:hypothetical protein
MAIGCYLKRCFRFFRGLQCVTHYEPWLLSNRPHSLVCLNLPGNDLCRGIQNPERYALLASISCVYRINRRNKSMISIPGSKSDLKEPDVFRMDFPVFQLVIPFLVILFSDPQSPGVISADRLHIKLRSLRLLYIKISRLTRKTFLRTDRDFALLRHSVEQIEPSTAPFPNLNLAKI